LRCVLSVALRFRWAALSLGCAFVGLCFRLGYVLSTGLCAFDDALVRLPAKANVPTCTAPRAGFTHHHSCLMRAHAAAKILDAIFAQTP